MTQMYPAGVSTRGVEDTTKGALGERRKRFNGVEAQQEALRGHRGVAQRADRAEVSLRVSRRGGAQAQLGQGSEECFFAGCLAGVGAGGYRGVQGIAQGCSEDKAPQNAFLRHLKSRGLGRGVGAVGVYSGVLSRGIAAAVRGAFLSQRVQPCSQGGRFGKRRGCSKRPSLRRTLSRREGKPRKWSSSLRACVWVKRRVG